MSSSRRHAPAKRGWSDQRRHDDHDDDGRQQWFAEERFPVERQAGSDPSEDQPDLATRDHADSDGKAVDPMTDDGDGACELAEDRR